MFAEIEMLRQIREHYRDASTAWVHNNFIVMIQMLKEAVKDTEFLIAYMERKHGTRSDSNEG
jgi:hypothetical protein